MTRTSITVSPNTDPKERVYVGVTRYVREGVTTNVAVTITTSASDMSLFLNEEQYEAFRSLVSTLPTGAAIPTWDTVGLRYVERTPVAELEA